VNSAVYHHVLPLLYHIAAPCPSPSPGASIPNVGIGCMPPNVFGTDLFEILDWTAWGATSCGVAGVLIVAGQMALKHQRGAPSEQITPLFWGLVGCRLIGAAGPLVSAFA
jgi:hypothetical protein